MSRPTVRILLAGLVCVSALIVTAPPAAACACVLRSPKQLLKQADAAFVGRVVSERTVNAVTTVQTFQVEGIFKGVLPSTVDVVAPLGPGGGSSCGLLFPSDQRVGVILYGNGARWTTDSCSLVSLDRLEAVAPSPVPPRAGVSASPTGGPVTPVAPDSSSEGLTWQTAVLGALLATAAIALLLSFGGRRERKEREMRDEEPAEQAPDDDEASPADPTQPTS